jgi:hypothetical protein
MHGKPHPLTSGLLRRVDSLLHRIGQVVASIAADRATNAQVRRVVRSLACISVPILPRPLSGQATTKTSTSTASTPSTSPTNSPDSTPRATGPYVIRSARQPKRWFYAGYSREASKDPDPQCGLVGCWGTTERNSGVRAVGHAVLQTRWSGPETSLPG